MRSVVHAQLGRRQVHMAIVWVILLSVVTTVLTSAQTPARQALPVDYAALLLRPADVQAVAAAGLTVHRPEAYGLDYSQAFTEPRSALQADPYAWSRGAITLSASQERDARAVLQAAGWRRLHEQVMAVPHEDAPNTYAFAIASGVEEYDDAAGAALAFRTLSGEDVLAEMALGTADEVAGAPARGDESGMWRIATDRWATSDVPAHHLALSMWVRLDHRIVGVTMFDFTSDAVVDPRVVDQFMGLLLERLAAAESLVTPRLSLCAPRLGGEPVIPGSDRYEVLSGTVIPLYGETPEARAARQQVTTEQGIVDRYAVTQRVAGSRLAATDDELIFTGWIIGFEDASTAETFQQGTEQRLGAVAELEQLELLPNPPHSGDSAVAYTFRYERIAVTTVSVRVEDRVVGVRLEGTGEPVPLLVEGLMHTQLERLEQASCMHPIPVPRSLLASESVAASDAR